MLTTRQFAARHADFAARGVEIVRVFRSPASALRPLCEGPRPVPFPIVADPGRVAYRLYRVGGSLASLASIFKPATRRRIAEAAHAGLKPSWRDMLRDGIGGSPADFLVGPDGRLRRVHYGEHFADSLLPAQALAWLDAEGLHAR